MIRALALILTLQLTGEALSSALSLPVPGPVIGMALLLLGLIAFGGPSDEVDGVGRGLLDNLGLLFVPAGVGVSLHLNRLANEGLAIGGAVVVATLASIVATAWVFGALSRLGRDQSSSTRRADGDEHG